MPGDPPVTELSFVPVGSLPRSPLEEVLSAVSRRVTVPCRLAETLDLQSIPMLEGRNQLDADALLQILEGRPASPSEVVVGLTRLDMGTRVFQFVFGRARKAGSAALVSTARLSPEFYGLPPDPALTRRRLVLEILHELGHIAGIGHCGDFACRMHFVANVESLDVRGNGLCRRCRDLELPGRKLSA